jgi:hypothetical protein
MPKYPLTLVTFFHPSELTMPAGLGMPGNLPFVTRSRAALKAEFEAFALERGLKGTDNWRDDGRVVRDYGEEVRRFRRQFINGQQLMRYLHEPRLIKTLGEPGDRPKWRIEFREKWNYKEGRLEPAAANALVREVGNAKLKINALWLNPPWVDDPNAESLRVNLVLGTSCERDALEAPLSLSASEGRFWIEWR